MSQTVEWAPFRRSYRQAIGVVRAHVQTLFDPAVLEPTFSIRTEVERIPWDGYSATLLKSWSRVASVLVARSCDDELEVLRSADTKRVDKAPSLARRLAVEWLEQRGLSLATSQSKKARAAMEDVLRDAVVNGWSVPETMRHLRESVGLISQDREALAAFKSRQPDNLTKKQLTTRVEVYRSRLIDQRAELIARTEIKSAVENGKLHAWRERQDQGALADGITREWVLDGRPCPICISIASQGPVPLNQPFRSSAGAFMSPPAHPRCACGTRLVRG